MLKKRSFLFYFIALCVSASLFAATAIAEEGGPTLLVIPARYTMVKLAFDIDAWRDALIVSYSGGGMSTDPTLHVWNEETREWSKIGIEEYSGGVLLGVQPEMIVLIGSEADLPFPLIEASSWCKEVKRIPTLDIVTIFNSLNESVKFSSSEWKWYADRYNLALKDLNAERRSRYEKYKKPEALEEEKSEAPASVGGGLEWEAPAMSGEAPPEMGIEEKPAVSPVEGSETTTIDMDAGMPSESVEIKEKSKDKPPESK